jgi:gas vesicle protein
LQNYGGEVEREAMSARPANLYVGMALLGGLVGAAVGLLVAPAPGTETRRRVVGRSIEDQELLLRRAEMAAELLGDELDLPATA